MHDSAIYHGPVARAACAILLVFGIASPLAAQCKPVAIADGVFSTPGTSWTSAKVTSGDRTAQMESGNFVVTVGTDKTTLGYGTSWRWRFIGSAHYLLAWNMSSVYVVDFTKSPPKLKEVMSSPSTPAITASAGTGSAFYVLAINTTLGKVVSSGVYRSDTGTFLCGGPMDIPTATKTQAEFKDGNVLITAGMDFSKTCPLRGCSSTSGSFPTTAVGLSSTATATLCNDGADGALITAIGPSASFRLTAASAAKLPLSLAVGTGESLGVTFTPKSAGTLSEMLPVKGASGETLCTIPLSATARAATFDVKITAARPFATRYTDESDDTVSFTVAKSGDGEVRIDSTELTGDSAHFTAAGPLPTGVPAPASLSVKFHPGSTPGTFGATLKVKATSLLVPSPSPATIVRTLALSGTTLERKPDIDCIAGVQHFEKLVGGRKYTLDLEFRNTGTKALTISDYAIKETNITAADNPVLGFETKPSTAPPLDPGLSRKVPFVFSSPFAGQLHTGVLTISSDDPDENPKHCEFDVRTLKVQRPYTFRESFITWLLTGLAGYFVVNRP